MADRRLWLQMTCMTETCPRYGQMVQEEFEPRPSGLLQSPMGLLCPGCLTSPMPGEMVSDPAPEEGAGG